MAKKQESISCAIKSLPDDLVQMGAEVACSVNPMNAPLAQLMPLMATAIMGDTPTVPLDPSYLAALTSRYWGTGGVRLTVGFMESTPRLS